MGQIVGGRAGGNNKQGGSPTKAQQHLSACPSVISYDKKVNFWVIYLSKLDFWLQFIQIVFFML